MNRGEKVVGQACNIILRKLIRTKNHRLQIKKDAKAVFDRLHRFIRYEPHSLE